MIVNGNYYDFEADDPSLTFLIDVKDRKKQAVAR